MKRCPHCAPNAQQAKSSDLFTVKQVCWDCSSFGTILSLVLVIPFLVHSNGLLHASLLGMTLLRVNLRLQTSDLLCKL